MTDSYTPKINPDSPFARNVASTLRALGAAIGEVNVANGWNRSRDMTAKSAAGITEVCLIRGPMDASSYRTTGKVAWVEFPSPHNVLQAWHTIPVPVSQLVGL